MSDSANVQENDENFSKLGDQQISEEKKDGIDLLCSCHPYMECRLWCIKCEIAVCEECLEKKTRRASYEEP